MSATLYNIEKELKELNKNFKLLLKFLKESSGRDKKDD